MGEITVAVVRVGTKYSLDYVYRIFNMVSRHSRGYVVDFVLYTDDPTPVPGFFTVVVDPNLTGWWGKMALFDETTRGRKPMVYFDLDTVIVGSLTPLYRFAYKEHFGVCANFTKRARNLDYPCAYGSCVMTLPPGFGQEIYRSFMDNQFRFMEQAGPYGDQWVIERLHPTAKLLQDELPSGFFVGRREFTTEVPKGASVMVFAGKNKPHNNDHKWVKENWR